jgi:sugar O-acyltransferase (sialic acid O-acetyltransferase NeuD family)
MQDNEENILIGCGPQAKYVSEILLLNDKRVSSIYDPIGGKVGEVLLGLKVNRFNLKSIANRSESGHLIQIYLCLKDNFKKKKLSAQLSKLYSITSAIHPSSNISPTAVVGRGSIINKSVVVEADARIGKECVLHAGTVIEHDCQIKSQCNLAPGVILSGGVTIGELTTIFSGTIVAPGVKIGKNSVIGAGSLVLQDIPSNVLAYGRPAQVVEKRASVK